MLSLNSLKILLQEVGKEGALCLSLLPQILANVLLAPLSFYAYSSRNYTVPDPPGLFDGHVWPMYVKHKNLMEDLNVDVGKCISIIS